MRRKRNFGNKWGDTIEEKENRKRNGRNESKN